MTPALGTGIGVFVLAGLVDVVVHATGGFPSWETPAHVATLAGMVVILAGIVVSARPIPRHTRSNKETRDAIR